MVLLLQAETRAEFAERSVAKLEKTIDDLEGMTLFKLYLSYFCSFCLSKMNTYYTDTGLFDC